MTNTLKDRVAEDWKVAQDKGGERIKRVRDILQSAAKEAFAEVKDGSAEIQLLGRDALAELIAQLKVDAPEEEAIASTPPIPPVEDETAVVVVEVAPEARSAPGWRSLMKELLGLVRDRKSDWLHSLSDQLQAQLSQFDKDMTAEYGDRYRRLRQQILRVQSWILAARAKAAESAKAAQEPAQPVSIEVLGDDAPVAEADR